MSKEISIRKERWRNQKKEGWKKKEGMSKEISKKEGEGRERHYQRLIVG